MADLGHGRGWLKDVPAESIARIDAELGHPLQTTETGRTWAQQNAHWLTFQRVGRPIALHPDTPSIHQLGAAIDTDEGQQFVALMNRHGWKQTVYRNGKLVEPWHFEYDPAADQYLGDDMFTQTDRDNVQMIRDYIGANGGMNTKTADSLGFKLNDVQKALTSALPVLLAKSSATDAAAIAKAVVAAIPADIAQDVIDGLAKRLQE